MPLFSSNAPETIHNFRPLVHDFHHVLLPVILNLIPYIFEPLAYLSFLSILVFHRKFDLHESNSNQDCAFPKGHSFLLIKKEIYR